MPLCIRVKHWQTTIASFLIPLALAGCGLSPKSPPPAAEAPSARQAAVPKSASRNVPALPRAGSGRGAYYQDDGPGDSVPEGLLDMPDPEPTIEPYSRYGNRSYVVFGNRYVPITDERPFKQRGVGSWYGKKFHGQRTSSGEPYDMYKMTAAHPTLPIPSFARVTNLDNGRQVIVRVNDRGPFHSSRIIDLSYTAALKLGYLQKGSGQLEVERLLPEEIERIARNRREQAGRVEQALNEPSMSNGMAAAVTVESVAAPSADRPQVAANLRPTIVTADQEAPPAAVPGFYLQLGAYTQASNAEAVRSRLLQRWSGALPPIEVVEYGMFHRLHSGPFATRADAALAALRLQDAGMPKALIVQR